MRENLPLLVLCGIKLRENYSVKDFCIFRSYISFCVVNRKLLDIALGNNLLHCIQMLQTRYRLLQLITLMPSTLELMQQRESFVQFIIMSCFPSVMYQCHDNIVRVGYIRTPAQHILCILKRTINSLSVLTCPIPRVLAGLLPFHRQVGSNLCSVFKTWKDRQREAGRLQTWYCH